MSIPGPKHLSNMFANHDITRLSSHHNLCRFIHLTHGGRSIQYYYCIINQIELRFEYIQINEYPLKKFTPEQNA